MREPEGPPAAIGDGANAAERHIQTVCLLTMTVLAVGASLYLLKPVLVPFVLALFVTYSLLPVIEVLQVRARMPYWLAAVLAGCMGLGLLVLLGVLVSGSINQMLSNADQYQRIVRAWIAHAREMLPTEVFGIPVEDRGISRFFSLPEQQVGGFLASTLQGVLSLVSDSFMVGIFVLFFLIGRGTAATPPNSPFGHVEKSVKDYLMLKVAISAVTGGAQGLALWFLGVDFAFVFGVLGFLLNFIPNVGPVLATLMPLPVLPLSPDMTLSTASLAIAIPGVIHFVSGNIVEPRLMGDSLDLHPVAVLLALIYFGMIWGMVGMFLATPITAVIKILSEQNDFTRPAGHVLAGRLSQESRQRADERARTRACAGDAQGRPSPAKESVRDLDGREIESGMLDDKKP
jgi:AI-2 transport protein TqsA